MCVSERACACAREYYHMILFFIINFLETQAILVIACTLIIIRIVN